MTDNAIQSREVDFGRDLFGRRLGLLISEWTDAAERGKTFACSLTLMRGGVLNINEGVRRFATASEREGHVNSRIDAIKANLARPRAATGPA